MSGLRYTDIDYLVFSNAANHVVNGSSPYKRPTYRHSPFPAYLLVPNSLFGRKFGKLRFALFDVTTGWLIRHLTKFSFSYSLWDFNPLVVNISTRGNSDSLTSFLLVFVLAFSSGTASLSRPLPSDSRCMSDQITIQKSEENGLKI
jgi:phosphatidylinositol glycan class M